MEIIQSIQNRIYEIRERVMLDFDLAALYEVEAGVLIQSVKRNIKKFPGRLYVPAEFYRVENDAVTHCYSI